MILWNLNPRWERTQKDQKGEERITATQRGIFLNPQYSHKHIQRSPTGFLELQNSVMRLFHTWTPRFPNWTPWRCSLRWHRDTSVHIKFVNAILVTSRQKTTGDNFWPIIMKNLIRGIPYVCHVRAERNVKKGAQLSTALTRQPV